MLRNKTQRTYFHENSRMRFLPDRSYNGSVMFPYTNYPPNFGRSVVMTRCFGFASIVYDALILLMLIKAMLIHAKSKGGSKKGGGMRFRCMWLLFGNAFCSLCHGIWIVVIVSVSMDYVQCKYYGLWGGLFYVSSNWFVYLLLFSRVSILKISERGRVGRLLFLAARLGIIATPLLALTCPLFFQGKLFFEEGMCVQDLSPFLCWLFTAMDSGLSFSFLYLFMEPVYKHLRLTHEAQADSNKALSTYVKKVARKNLLWGFVTILSTFIFMSILSAQSTILSIHEDPLDSHWRVEQWTGVLVDQNINTFSSLMITASVWVPKTWVRINHFLNGPHATVAIEPVTAPVSSSILSET